MVQLPSAVIEQHDDKNDHMKKTSKNKRNSHRIEYKKVMGIQDEQLCLLAIIMISSGVGYYFFIYTAYAQIKCLSDSFKIVPLPDLATGRCSAKGIVLPELEQFDSPGMCNL